MIAATTAPLKPMAFSIEPDDPEDFDLLHPESLLIEADYRARKAAHVATACVAILAAQAFGPAVGLVLFLGRTGALNIYDKLYQLTAMEEQPT